MSVFIERLKKSKIARLTIPQRYVGYSATWAILIKARIALQWIAMSLLTNPLTRFRCRKITKLLRTEGRDTNAIVFANGPSVNGLNVSYVENLRANNRIKIFAVNFYAKAEIAKRLIPDYYVLSDPATRPDSQAENVDQLWEILDKWQGTKILVPQNWYNLVKLRPDFSRFAFFDDRGLEFISNSISPLRARGYCSMSAFKALAFANFMQFNKIYLLGFDNSMFYKVRGNEKNELMESENLHFYSVQQEKNQKLKNLDEFFPGGMQDYLFAHAVLFHDLTRCFSRINAINLDPNSLVQTFQKDVSVSNLWLLDKYSVGSEDE